VARDGLDELRASDADRQQVSQLLQTACAEGRLTMDEFSERVERALVAPRLLVRGMVMIGSATVRDLW